MAKHVYAIQGERLINLRTHLRLGTGDDKRSFTVKFENNRFVTEVDEIAEAMDTLLKDGFGISVFCTKVDSARADTFVKERVAAAAKGGLTASLMSSLENQSHITAQKQLDAVTDSLLPNNELMPTVGVDVKPKGTVAAKPVSVKVNVNEGE